MMNLYDELIANLLSLLEKWPCKMLDTSDSKWLDAGKQNLVLRGEMAYELGAGTLPAVGFLGVSSSEQLMQNSGVFLYGKDLSEINENTPYARVTLLRVSEQSLGDGEKTYDSLRRLEYTRYKISPKGFMSRIASGVNREPTRISRAALQKGLSFADVGKIYSDAYLSHPEVEAARIVFITLPYFPYDELSKLSIRSEQITQALDHILRDVKMDCGTCGLREICNEVEGIMDLHFK